MNISLNERIGRRLDEIDEKGLTRKLAQPRGIDFSSNDYLNLANDERIKSAAQAGIEREGVGATASRLLRGEREVFTEVEKQFAAWKNADRSLFFSSGYAANLGILTSFIEEGDLVFSDELNHASLIDGIRLSKGEKVVYKHRDIDQLSKLLRETKTSGQKFLITESLFSMDGTISDLGKYTEICSQTGTALIVDEAHAVGIFGETGSGLIEEFGIEDSVFLSMNTAGKALGVSGAFVAGSGKAIEYLLQKARSFIFSTAPIPAIAHALKASITIVQEEKERREKLLGISSFLRNILNDFGISISLENSQILPIMIGESNRAVAVARKLQEAGFDVRAIRPPTVAVGTARLRVSLNSELSKEVLINFADKLSKVMKEV